MSFKPNMLQQVFILTSYGLYKNLFPLVKKAYILFCMTFIFIYELWVIFEWHFFRNKICIVEECASFIKQPHQDLV